MLKQTIRNLLNLRNQNLVMIKNKFINKIILKFVKLKIKNLINYYKLNTFIMMKNQFKINILKNMITINKMKK